MDETIETLENIKCLMETKFNRFGMTERVVHTMYLKTISWIITLIIILSGGIYWWMTSKTTILSIGAGICIFNISEMLFDNNIYKKYLVLDDKKTKCCICKDKKYCYKLGCSDKHHICVECGDGLKLSKCPLCRKPIECFIAIDFSENDKKLKNPEALTVFQLYENVRPQGCIKSD